MKRLKILATITLGLFSLNLSYVYAGLNDAASFSQSRQDSLTTPSPSISLESHTGGEDSIPKLQQGPGVDFFQLSGGIFSPSLDRSAQDSPVDADPGIRLGGMRQLSDLGIEVAAPSTDPLNFETQLKDYANRLLDRSGFTRDDFLVTKYNFPYIEWSFGDMTYQEFMDHDITQEETDFVVDILRFGLENDYDRFSELLTETENVVLLSNPNHPAAEMGPGGATGYGIYETQSIVFDFLGGPIFKVDETNVGGLTSFVAHEMAHVYGGRRGLFNVQSVDNEIYARRETIRWMEMLGEPEEYINEERWMADIAGDNTPEAETVRSYYWANGATHEEATTPIVAAQYHFMEQEYKDFKYESSSDARVSGGREGYHFRFKTEDNRTLRNFVSTYGNSGDKVWIRDGSEWSIYDDRSDVIEGTLNPLVSEVMEKSNVLETNRKEEFKNLQKDVDIIGETYPLSEFFVQGNLITTPKDLTYNVLTKFVWNEKALVERKYSLIEEFSDGEILKAKDLGFESFRLMLLWLDPRSFPYKTRDELNDTIIEINDAISSTEKGINGLPARYDLLSEKILKFYGEDS